MHDEIESLSLAAAVPLGDLLSAAAAVLDTSD